ncbi:MAG TPA: protein kinase, partial [Gemmataceae bacterium]
MPFASGLLGLGLRQAIDSAIDRVALAVQRHLTDHAEALPRALCRANDRTWRALAVALAGDRLLGRVRALLAGGDVRSVREQVRFFLQTCAPEFEKEPEAYRRTCLAELNDARRAGLLSAEGVTPAELAEQAARFPRFSEDPQTAFAEAQAAVACLTDELAPRCRHLADLIGRPTPGGVPLVLAAFVFFFRREVETDPELARGLNFETLRRLTAAQEAGLARIDGALEGMGRQVDQALASLAAMQDEIRALFREVCERLDRAEMREPEVRPWHSLSIRGDAEKQAVRALLARFRELPPEEQQHLPGLLNGLGKLQIGTGDFHGAWESFEKAATAAPDAAAQAQAHHNAYRAALEERNWSEALAAILRAVELDPRRFTPFPLHRYRPERILGAGGFGTVFLCHDRNFDEPVVVKSLHAADLERDMAEVFREARVLRRLSHESIIGVRDCEYADPAAAARPFVVMD